MNKIFDSILGDTENITESSEKAEITLDVVLSAVGALNAKIDTLLMQKQTIETVSEDESESESETETESEDENE